MRLKIELILIPNQLFTIKIVASIIKEIHNLQIKHAIFL